MPGSMYSMKFLNINKERKKILENKKKVNDEIKKLLTDIKNLSGEELIKSLKEKLK